MIAAAAILAVAVQASPGASPPPSPGASPATSASPRAGTEGHFAGADGARLFHRRVGSGAKLVVFLNGGAGSTFAGAAHLEPLAARDRSVIFYDARGSGASDLIADPSLLTADHHVRDVEALRVHLGAPRISLVALASGAPLAARYAALHPDHVERLVLVNPGPLDGADLGATVEELKVPVLVVDGRESGATAAAAREWAAVLPDARLLLIRRAGPDVVADQPAAFTAAVKQFLAGRHPAGSEVVPGPDAH